MKEHRLLADNPSERAERGELDLARIDAVDKDTALGWLVKPRDQIDERALPGTTRSDEGDYFSLPRGEIDSRQYGCLSIGEADVLESQLALERRRLPRSAVALELGGRIEDLEQSFRRCER